MQASSEPPTERERFRIFVRDAVTGLAGAFGKLVTGTPFETLKVRMQSLATRDRTKDEAKFNSMWSALTKTVKDEGVRGLYRGLTPNIPTCLTMSVVNFAAFGQMSLHLSDNPSKLTIAQVAFCGSFSGACQSIFLSPLELIRCRLQVQRSNVAQSLLYRGPIDCLKQTYRQGGFVKGLYKGYSLTLLRELPSNAAYFATYETVLRWAGRGSNSDRLSEAHPFWLILAGGLAGVANWSIIFPLDTLKTRYQTDDIHRPKYASIADCYRQTVAQEGHRGLWKGLGPCLTRAFVANAATFLCVENARKALRWMGF